MRQIIITLFLLAAMDSMAQEVVRVQKGAKFTVENGALLTIAGGMALEKGSGLTNNGKITLLRNAVGGQADWIDSSDMSYSYGSGVVVFNSSGDQKLLSVDSFHRIEVDAGSIHLATDIAADQWYLINGRISTGRFKGVVLSSSDTAVAADNSNTNFTKSWFDGGLRRRFSSNSANTFFFPLGDPNLSHLLVMDGLKTAPLNNISYLDASFGPKPGTDAGLILQENGTPYTMINDAGVWYVTPDKEPTAGSYDLLLYLDGFTGLVDNSFTILRRPDSSKTASDWEVPEKSALPAAGTPGRTVAGGYAKRNSMSSFSQYGIGMTSTPLPVTLTDLKAYRIDPAKVGLEWQTLTEVNNRGFNVEKRQDNDTSFSSSGFVPSAAPGGNSSVVLFYTYTDANAYHGVTYYRLKQTDLDGHYTYTLVKAVSGDGAAGVSVLLYPNPSQGQFSIRMDGAAGTQHYVRIVDEKGAILKSMLLMGNEALPVTGLRPGTYVVQIPDAFGPGKLFAEKIVVLK
ncbi:MAG: T9SS type A sorting domain-containing protein [Bacteroidetes bacterium]|nr:T9SS type A sorting domain-containing protein [Bacteroidota bacterium]